MSDAPNSTDPVGGGEPLETEAPRRAASARFEVAGRDDLGMRDALDPATQSLGDALKLSYRILQAGIVALVVVFLFSGFQSVPEGFTGVKTLCGAVAGDEGEEQVQPGLQPFWPYPIGDLQVFEQRRTIRLDREFWPAAMRQGDERQKTIQEQIDSADPNSGLRPGSDGSLLTKDGDLVHAQFEAEYIVVDAVKYLESTAPQFGDRIVAAAVKQAAVEAASTFTLAEFTDTRDTVGPAVRERAQRTLDRLEVGIELASVRGTERIAPLTVQNRLREVQSARENSKGEVERARQNAVTILTQIAGGEVYSDLLALIRRYEEALESGRAADAEAILGQLGARMEAPDVGGEVSKIIAQAQASQASLRARLERDSKRVESLAASFKESRGQVVKQLWLDAVREALENPQAEMFASPLALGELNLKIKSSNDIMQLRRQAELDRKKAEEAARAAGTFYAPNSEQIFINRAGRRLKRDATGGVGR
jgi:regulator of protease activity HflC (stomatin/prohibitin superfamily)